VRGEGCADRECGLWLPEHPACGSCGECDDGQSCSESGRCVSERQADCPPPPRCDEPQRSGDDDSCSVSVECDDGIERSASCDGSGCECTYDGVSTATPLPVPCAQAEDADDSLVASYLESCWQLRDSCAGGTAVASVPGTASSPGSGGGFGNTDGVAGTGGVNPQPSPAGGCVMCGANECGGVAVAGMQLPGCCVDGTDACGASAEAFGMGCVDVTDSMFAMFGFTVELLSCDGSAAPSDPAMPPADQPAVDPDPEPEDDPDPQPPIPPMPPPPPMLPLPGGCDAGSGYPGDEACLPAPDPALGFQVHIGPDDYDDPKSVQPFLMNPGQESGECFALTMPNTEQVLYRTVQMSARPGFFASRLSTFTTPNGGAGFQLCRNSADGSDPGFDRTLYFSSGPTHAPQPDAPENGNLGGTIGPNSAAEQFMHAYNFSDSPMLREVWINVYYAQPGPFPAEYGLVSALGGVTWNIIPIAPGTSQVYPFSCPITQAGRLIRLGGHVHSHNVRLTAWLNRGTADEVKLLERYDFLEQSDAFFDSVTTNPGFGANQDGAYSGIVDIGLGDTLDWECHVVNDSATPLRYTNEIATGEMCNLAGVTSGPNISCFQ